MLGTVHFKKIITVMDIASMKFCTVFDALFAQFIAMRNDNLFQNSADFLDGFR